MKGTLVLDLAWATCNTALKHILHGYFMPFLELSVTVGKIR